MALKNYYTLASGQKLPVIGLGTWETKNDEEIETALNTALELGYRHIDTAIVYQNEVGIGKVLQKWFSSGKLKREDLFITTKLPMSGVHQDRVELFLKQSLKNLGLDYVDLYLIHFAVGCVNDGETCRPLFKDGQVVLEPKTDHLAIWKKMEEQVDAGRTKNIGLSNFNKSQVERIFKAARIKPANLQVELHVYLQQRELVDFCLQNNISVVAYSPLGNPGFNKFLASIGQEPKKLPNVLSDSVINKIAQKHSKSPAQIALRFLIQRGIIVIPKSVTAKRIQENFEIFDFELDQSDMTALYELDVGEDARVCDFLMWKGVSESPEFPFRK